MSALAREDIKFGAARPPKVIAGDSLHVLKSFPDASIDAVVTDPPYALTDLPTGKVTEALTRWVGGERAWVPAGGRGFMGNGWDRFVPPPALWDQVYRVLKPGGIALVFAGARTFDLMGISCRLAGFDVRDSVAWIQAQSMPKTSDLGKVTGNQEWKGWSTGLKSSNEPFLVLRKPLDGTMKAHIVKHRTGAYNIDATRVSHTPAPAHPGQAGGAETAEFVVAEQSGRWTPNVVFSHHPDCRPAGTTVVATNSHHPASRPGGGIGSTGHQGQLGLTERRPGTEVVQLSDCHPDCPVQALDAQSGVLTSGANPTRRHSERFRNLYGKFDGSGEPATVYRGADVGGASRFYPAFYYCPKASQAERPRVPGLVREVFPTVKPLALTRWMVNLIGVPGCVILDPFAGSGTTGEACLLEGFDSVLIEREPEHLLFINERLSKHLPPPVEPPLPVP